MRKFFAVLRMAVIDALIYKGDMLLWSIDLLIGPLVYMVVWLAVSADGKNLPLSSTGFVQYFLLVILIRLWANAWNSHSIGRDIRTGEISRFLIKPMSYLFYRFGDSVGYRLVKGIFGGLAFAALAFVFHFQIPGASSLVWLAFLYSVFVSGLMMTLYDLNIGLTAFWLDDVVAVDDALSIFYGSFSGLFIPLAVLPVFFQNTLVFLPFKYLLGFPIEIILGKSQGLDLCIGLLIQTVWLAIFFAIYWLLWTKGQRRYQSYGT